MQELKELISLSATGKIDSPAFLDSSYNREGNKTLAHKLYKMASDETIISNAAAMTSLYGDHSSPFKYNVLKKRLKEKLLNTVLFLKPGKSESGTLLLSMYWCHKNYVIADLLLSVSLKKIGIRLMKNVLKRALRYEFFDIVRLGASLLRREAMQEGNLKSFNYYNAIARKGHKMIVAEDKIEALYHNILIHYTASGSYKPHMAKKAKSAIIKIGAIRDHYDSYQISYYYYNAQILYYQISMEYDKALDLCIEFEKKYLSNEKALFYTRHRHANFLIQKLNCCLHVRNFEEGVKSAKFAGSVYEAGRGNWYTLQDLYFLLSLNSDELSTACEIFTSVTSSRRFEMLPAYVREKWKLFGAYLWLMVSSSTEEGELKNLLPKESKISIGKLINEMIIFSRDKQGYNIAILTIQIIVSLQKKDFESVVKRMESIRNYIYKHLKKNDPSYRSQVFFKLLTLVERCDFDAKLINVKAEKMLMRLHNAQINFEMHPSRYEIVPYETLFAMIMRILGDPAGEAYGYNLFKERNLHHSSQVDK
ncbi:MAG: hypothetical protein M3Q97_02040 [Bacteroidota bacterium]|nr:hypothetical protein [Bacteroidota bacterium]